jgi:hypothetical protein
MTTSRPVKLFESTRVRSHWDAPQEKWFFAVVVVVKVLTDSVNPADYLKKLRKRNAELGDYSGTNCPQVAMPSESGVMRKTLTADPPTLLRLIQSITSPKAQPFKRWLAKVGHECMQQMAHLVQSLGHGSHRQRCS